GRAQGRADDDPGLARDRVLRLRRLGRQARDRADDLPRVRRARGGGRGAGAVRALAPLPALSRQRHRDRGSLPAVPGHRPRAEDGKLLKIKGHGAPRLKGAGRGDLIARLKLTVPQKLSKAEKEALENLKQVSRENPREKASS